MILAWILAFGLMGSLGSVGAAGLLLLLPDRWTVRLLPGLVSYAIGTLLGAAWLGMIPHALEHLPARSVTTMVLAGIVVFYILESSLVWRHCHEGDCQVHSNAGFFILVGDAFHNFVDGLVVASTFLLSIPVGIMASMAVIAHEIPQEVGDFAILLHSGYSRGKALFYNALSSMAMLVGALVGYLGMNRLGSIVPYVLCVSAASFLYIALADVIPGRRKRKGLGIMVELALVIAGIMTIWLMSHQH